LRRRPASLIILFAKQNKNPALLSKCGVVSVFVSLSFVDDSRPSAVPKESDPQGAVVDLGEGGLFSIDNKALALYWASMLA